MPEKQLNFRSEIFVAAF